MFAKKVTVLALLIATSIVSLPVREVVAAPPPAPTVTSISPDAGPVAGGTTITVTGTGFVDTGATASVSIGGVAATNVTVTTSTILTFVTPVRTGSDRKAGPVPVVVTMTNGPDSTSSNTDKTFLYRPLLGTTGVSVSNKVLTGGVATLTTSSAHGLLVGQTAYVTGVDATFNGIFVVTAVTTTPAHTFSYAVTAADVPTAVASGAVAKGAPTPLVGTVAIANNSSTNNGLVILGDLAVASQRKVLSNTFTGVAPATGPSTRTGTFSAGTAATAGDAYTYASDFFYNPSEEAYGYESDERSTDDDFITTFNSNASYQTRSGVYKLTSDTWCKTVPNGSSTPMNQNTKDGFETYCSVYGPEVFSEVFYAEIGQALSFEWAAERITDDYEIYAYLVKVPSLTDVLAAGTDHTVVAHALGKNATWTTESASIPSNGFYRFRFVNGSFDGTGGNALGSNMYISPVVVVALANTITFPGISDKVGVVATTAYTVPVSATSGVAVTVTSSTTGVCTVGTPNATEVVITWISDGQCTLVASQGATGNYAPASQVTQSFQFLDEEQAPNVSTGVAGSVTSSSATLNGTINPRGAAVTSAAFCYGTALNLSGCTNASATPLPGATAPATSVSASLTGLVASTTYYYRLSATNSVSTTDGSILSFTTSAGSGGGGGAGGGSSGGGGSTVVDVVVPPIQGPTLDLISTPATRGVGPGGSTILFNGNLSPITSSRNAKSNALILSGGSWQISLGALNNSGNRIPLSKSGVIDAITGQRLNVSGFGFAPNTEVWIFVISPPIQIGRLAVGPDGRYNGNVLLPATLSPGDVIVQANGFSSDQVVRSASLALRLSAPSNVARISARVNFDVLSPQLDAQAQRIIKNLIARIPKGSRGFTIQSIGFVQPAVTRANDAPLSLARARTSIAFVRDIGGKRFDAASVYVSGLGRSKLPGASARNAVVTISFIKT